MVAVSFIVGAICSALAGFIGMRVATKANVRTTNAARKSLGAALEVAFAGGAVMGLGVVGLGVLGLSSLFILYSGQGWEIGEVLNVLSGFLLVHLLLHYLLVWVVVSTLKLPMLVLTL